MISAAEERKGRPFVFLLVLVGGWTMLRVATWQDPFPHDLVQEWVVPSRGKLAVVGERVAAEREDNAQPAGPDGGLAGAGSAAPALSIQPRAAAKDEPPFAQGRTLAGHNLLLMSAMARLPMPTSVAGLIDESAGGRTFAIPAVPTAAAKPGGRWRFDGWLVLRAGGRGTPAAGALPPSYGSSQAGGMLAYDLAPQSRLRPSLYLRASSALRDPQDAVIALGVRAIPFGGLPLQLHGELRVVDRGGGMATEPAALVSAGHETRSLPLGLGARAYGQAGYVGGDFATPFADGSLVIDREVARFDLGRIRTGAGAWGGAQRGASRFDVGPTASLDLALADVPARIAIDYRIRLSGNAQPRTGAALTLSTGF